MVFNATLGTQTFTDKQIIDQAHPAIIRSLKVKANNGILSAGLIVAKDSAGDLVAYDSAGASPINTPVGVVTISCDTTKEGVAATLLHGTVVSANLLEGSSAAGATEIAALQAIGIFAI